MMQARGRFEWDFSRAADLEETRDFFRRWVRVSGHAARANLGAGIERRHRGHEAADVACRGDLIERGREF